ncbi:MAG: hypothetical protein MZV70_20290 [Desulfobacterales bacterium]|nr:hypothetical protein [Desulfobacterales bacterium]
MPGEELTGLLHRHRLPLAPGLRREARHPARRGGDRRRQHGHRLHAQPAPAGRRQGLPGLPPHAQGDARQRGRGRGGRGAKACELMFLSAPVRVIGDDQGQRHPPGIPAHGAGRAGCQRPAPAGPGEGLRNPAADRHGDLGHRPGAGRLLRRQADSPRAG